MILGHQFDREPGLGSEGRHEGLHEPRHECPRKCRALHLLAGPIELQRGDLPSLWVSLPLASEPRPDLAEAEADHQAAHSPRLGQQDH